MINTTYVRFHRLADDLKAAVTSPDAIEQIEKLEQKYGVALADLLIRLMVKEVSLADLPSEIVKESKLEQPQVSALLQDLQTTLLRQVMPYLSQPTMREQPIPLRPPAPPPSPTQPLPPSPPPATVQASPVRPSRPLPPPLPTSALVQPARPQPAQPARRPVAQEPRPTPPPVMRPAPTQPMQRPTAAPMGKQAAARASYYIHPDDEADIARHRDRLRELAGPSPTAELRPIIDALISRAGIRVPPDQATRLSALLLSRLRDVRTSEELSANLIRPWQEGGMGLEASAALQLARMTDDEAAKLHDAQLARHLATPPVAPAQPPLVRPATTLPPAEPVPAPSRPAAPVPLPAPSPPSPPPPPPPQQSQSPQRGTARPRPVPLQPQTTVRPVVERAGVSETNQRLIHDIKRPVRPVSPAEELASLTADDFRQMARTFAEAAGKVLERIHLLAEDSYSKRSEGIAAWRSSDLHKLYLAIGGESMATAQSIDVVIERRKATGQPYLTADEFAVLADLNRQLTM